MSDYSGYGWTVMDIRNIIQVGGELIIMENYLTKKQVAELWQVHERTVYVWTKKGLPHFRQGHNLLRFDRHVVEEWLNSRNKSVKQTGVAVNGG